ncbi:phytoene desaturase family protein [Lysinibacillus sp. RC79]|uniref:phytoene desaturase family protein n=1 Tax=Lysinibacillus sp. RC79 TaxID=3156296 RepID=UPI003518C4A7
MTSQDYDVIVIGSGIGGLASASAMASKGYKVLVCEAEGRMGGYCQSFDRKGFRFNSSIHKIGGPFPRYLIEKFLSLMGENSQLEWTEFEEYVQVDSIKINSGSKTLNQDLKEYFPHESTQLDVFFSDIRLVYKELIYLEKNRNNITAFNPTAMKLLMQYQVITIEQLLNKYFQDEHLKGILYGLCDGMPGQSAIVLVVFFNLLIGNNSVLPVGGAESILNIMLKVVEKAEGKLILNSPVERILVEDGHVIGVEVNGQEILSKFVVSNADIYTTYEKLIGKEHIPPRFLNKMHNVWKPSSSCFSVWLGLDCPIQDLGWNGQNVNYYQGYDRLFNMKEDLVTSGGRLPKDAFCWVGTSANLDPTASPSGYSQVSLGIPISYQYENSWGIVNGRRGREYRDTKMRLAEQLINSVEQIMPGLQKHIFTSTIATPLTFERYSRNVGGSYLGFAFEPAYLQDRMRPESKGLLQGLYLSSNWSSMGGGFIKVMMEAIRGADLMLMEDGRTDFYDFQNKYFFEQMSSLKI